jgi:hypothetical protein
MNDTWQTILSKIAPTAATLLGGPFAGLAVTALSKALGVDGATVSQVQQAITGSQLSGDQILALKQAELDLQKHLADNNITLDQISMEDRDSARKREIAVKDNTPKILAYSVTVGFFGTLSLMLFGAAIPAAGHDVLLVMIGSLGTAWTGIIAYYFGSSAGSAAKTNLLAKAAPVDTTT